MVALDADTGKLKWHYQFSPHNEFDWDSMQVPVLADMQWKGSPRKVMLWANRSGVFYVLDRTTGEFLLGKPFVKTNWVNGFDEKGRPIRAPGIEPTKDGTLVFPGNQGATNWYNPSYSPQTGLFYIPTWENSSTTYIKDQEPPEFHSGQTFSGVFPKNSNGADIYSAIRAIDPADRREEVGLSIERAINRSGHSHRLRQRAFQRRPRWPVLRARCARRKAVVGDESRTFGFSGRDDVLGRRESST